LIFNRAEFKLPSARAQFHNRAGPGQRSPGSFQDIRIPSTALSLVEGALVFDFHLPSAVLALLCAVVGSAFANPSPQDSQPIDAAHAELLVRSYKRCIGNHRADETRLLSASLPFDLDALGLLTGRDIDVAPRESVGTTVFIRCEWFDLAPRKRQ